MANWLKLVATSGGHVGLAEESNKLIATRLSQPLMFLYTLIRDLHKGQYLFLDRLKQVLPWLRDEFIKLKIFCPYFFSV